MNKKKKKKKVIIISECTCFATVLPLSSCLFFFFGHVLARSRLNVAKTEFMVISSRQKMQSLNEKTINVNVEGVKINQTDHSKALGLNIDENLSWRNTYTQLQKRSLPVSSSSLPSPSWFV